MNKQYDRSMMGDEPKFSGRISRIDLINALNWYNYYYTVSDCRHWIVDYMSARKYSKFEIDCYKRSADRYTTQTMCSIARLLINGAVFENKLDDQLKTIINANKPVDNVVKFPTNTLIASVDQLVDRFIENNYSGTIEQISLAGCSRQQVAQAVANYTNLLNELNAITTDSTVAEYYDHLNIRQRNRYIKFIEQIVQLLSSGKIRRVPVVRKARKKKVKPASTIVRKINLMQSDKETGIQSIKPETIIGCTVLWTFNTKSRKLTKYLAKAGTTLTIKGTTIINYDPAKSFTKTIRKPKVIVPFVNSQAKSAVETAVSKIKAKAGPVRGRTNDKTLLVRAFK